MSAPRPEGGSGGARCPVRKLIPPGQAAVGADGPDVEHVDAVRVGDVTGIHGPRWVIRSYAAACELFQSEASLGQAGFGALTFIKPASEAPGPEVSSRALRPPVLYLDGPAHRDRRRAAARFFTPKAVDTYRGTVEDLTRDLLKPLAAGRPADVSRLSLLLSVAVVAKVTGLTSSPLPGMSRRIAATFTANLSDEGRGLTVLAHRLVTGAAILAFYVVDVLPAIHARRRRPADDLISHLLEVGFRPLEILTECIIYCAAGMATTREFVTLSAWHLLDSPALLARFRAAHQDGRMAVLQETLRLEPVIGHLYRRVTAPTTLVVGGTATVLPAGSIVDLDLRAINTDTALVGAEPCTLRPGRPLSARGAGPAVMSFGDGQHRCPGGPLAMLESEVFLSRLLELDLVIDRPPTVSWSDLTGGYDLRGLTVRTRDARIKAADRPAKTKRRTPRERDETKRKCRQRPRSGPGDG